MEADASCGDRRLIIKSAGRNWVLEKAGNLEELWEEMAHDNPDERIPYWTELWPASLVLAQWLTMRKKEIMGQPCVDLGCGLGLTALLGQEFGANVLAVDHDFTALEYCRKNALLNGVDVPICVNMDWRAIAFQEGAIYRVWAGDIIYEKRFIAPVLDFLEYCLHKTGKAWIAEPGRSIFSIFLLQAEEKGWNIKKAHAAEAPAMYAGNPSVQASVWELWR